MKYFILLFLINAASYVYGQETDLIIEDGNEFYVPLGYVITSDFITVNLNASFISEDPSGVAPGTIIRGEGTIALPVELSSFTATVSNRQVTLKWTTETEIDNYGFEVERTLSSTTPLQGWEKIGFVQGSGNSNSPNEYSYIDKKLIGGSKFMYRLKQIDNTGQYEYSNEVEVNLIPTEYALFQNYPNPFNPSTTIRYQLPKESKVAIKIYSILGSEVMELLNEQKEAGTYEIEFNAEVLSSGTYIYRIIADDFIQTKKMTLIK